ncbi:tetratricopeptide repeat protein [Microbulbifer aggregans]|uniref:tetratricopeptide repeat protein n=1 Tax=Microbulbifer aggregans TaxID=1769779 RepID=UPI0039A510F5
MAGKDSPLLRFGLGSALFNLKEYDEAIPHLQECLKQMPDHSAAWKLLGRCQMASGNDQAAVDVFQRGLEVAKKKSDIQVEREISVFLNKLARKSD